MKPTPLASAALALLVLAPSAWAQSGPADWSGFSIGANAGGADPAGVSGGRFGFDTNLDGRDGDQVSTVTGADAFSPGFCGGAAAGRTPASGCSKDKGGAEYGARLGYDWQADNWVYGVVAEYTRNDVHDSVSAFSTTPAFYTFTRQLNRTAALRGRIGYAFGTQGDYLAYITAGVARGEFDHRFASSNTANSFTSSGGDSADGYQAGIGLQRRLSDKVSVGVEYLFTRLQDDDTRVRVGPGTAPATNPFLRVNPAGTDLRRTDTDVSTNAVRLTATYRF
ncbi:outer membrane protein [Xanthomonas sp. NCPPB 3761]|uniref:outer membrane protein n=1 Tax=Xanthomonas sp. NCPPB 3761 TaxID=487559 RepID=UPI003557BDF2